MVNAYEILGSPRHITDMTLGPHYNVVKYMNFYALTKGIHNRHLQEEIRKKINTFRFKDASSGAMTSIQNFDAVFLFPYQAIGCVTMISFPSITAVPRSVKRQSGLAMEELRPLDGSSFKSSATRCLTLSLIPREPETPVDRIPPTVIHCLWKKNQANQGRIQEDF